MEYNPILNTALLGHPLILRQVEQNSLEDDYDMNGKENCDPKEKEKKDIIIENSSYWKFLVIEIDVITVFFSLNPLPPAH